MIKVVEVNDTDEAENNKATQVSIYEEAENQKGIYWMPV